MCRAEIMQTLCGPEARVPLKKQSPELLEQIRAFIQPVDFGNERFMWIIAK
jgi:hypothetical protein